MSAETADDELEHIKSNLSTKYEDAVVEIFINYCREQQYEEENIKEDIEQATDSTIYRYMQSTLQWNDEKTNQFIKTLKNAINPSIIENINNVNGTHYNKSFASWKKSFIWFHSTPNLCGVVGLTNLGNTSFINSTIQCLAQSPILSVYFLSNEYMNHVNKNGRIATMWAALLHEIFTDHNINQVIDSKEFNHLITELAPYLTKKKQLDSYELLSFLLNTLHEDLNQITNKPAAVHVDANGRESEKVALEAWKVYLQRNESVMVDLFAGQQKPTIICLHCRTSFMTFESYMSISLPIPIQKYVVIEYTFIDLNIDVAPTVYGAKMLCVADIQMLKELVAKRHGVPKEEIFVCDIWKSKIHRELRRHDSVSDINRREDDIFIYRSKRPDMNEWDGEEIMNTKRYRSTFQTFVVDNKQYEQEGAIGYPLLITLPTKIQVTMNEIRVKIWQLIKPFLRNEALKMDDANLPFELCAAWNTNRDAQVLDPDDSRIEILNSDHVFNLHQINLKFIIYWKDTQEYKSKLYDFKNRTLDDSAPLPLDGNSVISFCNIFGTIYNKPSVIVHGYIRRINQIFTENKQNYVIPVAIIKLCYDYYLTNTAEKVRNVSLSECIEKFCAPQTFTADDDEWYCPTCQDYQYSEKKVDLWSCGDLLIINLKRYVKNENDRKINRLIEFPIEGLDLSPYLLSSEHRKDAIYDLYAVSNYMDSDRYTSFVKNLDNKQWYHLDDDMITKVENVETIVTVAAYILYYHKRNPRNIKHTASQIVI